MIVIANLLAGPAARCTPTFLILDMFLCTARRRFARRWRRRPTRRQPGALQRLARRRPDPGTGSGHARPRFQIKVFFLGCVIVDAITVNRRMPFVQALPAAIALILLTLA
jgi:hypothetical protein